jgi:hypothetical protein
MDFFLNMVVGLIEKIDSFIPDLIELILGGPCQFASSFKFSIVIPQSIFHFFQPVIVKFQLLKDDMQSGGGQSVTHFSRALVFGTIASIWAFSRASLSMKCCSSSKLGF